MKKKIIPLKDFKFFSAYFSHKGGGLIVTGKTIKEALKRGMEEAKKYNIGFNRVSGKYGVEIEGTLPSGQNVKIPRKEWEYLIK